jgi:DNA invertase Pin-like site-specific DNA recombinase
MTVIAYCRVSTTGQTLDSKIAAVTAAGASAIFKEKISGARADRPQLANLMASLRKGHVVIITKIDRLARSLRELLNLIAIIDEKGAALRSLGDPLFCTDHAQGRLLIAVLGAVAHSKPN